MAGHAGDDQDVGVGQAVGRGEVGARRVQREQVAQVLGPHREAGHADGVQAGHGAVGDVAGRDRQGQGIVVDEEGGLQHVQAGDADRTPVSGREHAQLGVAIDDRARHVAAIEGRLDGDGAAGESVCEPDEVERGRLGLAARAVLDEQPQRDRRLGIAGTLLGERRRERGERAAGPRPPARSGSMDRVRIVVISYLWTWMTRP